MPETLHRLNCWEFKNCGREPGGLMAGMLGECPVARAAKHHGVNGGTGAGRLCWLMNDESGCTARGYRRAGRCLDCDFYRRVVFEEDDTAVHTFRQEPT